MRKHLGLVLALSFVGLVLGCSGDKPPRPLRVGVEPAIRGNGGVPAPQTIGSGGATGMAGTPAGRTSEAEGALHVRIQNPSAMVIEIVTLQCAGDCAEIEAVPHGGNPPYTVRWEDGTTSTARHVCLDASTQLSVSATDTSIPSDEFHYDAQTVTAAITATVLDCRDGGLPDAGMLCTAPEAGPACDLGGGITLPEEITVDLFAEVRYFAAGAALPAGRYRLTYIDGCNTYGSPAIIGSDAGPADFGLGWSVNGSADPPGPENCSLVGDDGMPFLVTPGKVGIFLGDVGAFETYAACVAGNCEEPPVEFDYAGGKLGLLRDGGGALGAVDDLDGSSEGGRAPTFRLTRIDGPCQ